MTKNGGYSIVNLASSTLYADLQKVSALEKPILVYGDDQPYYADELTTDGSSFDITKGGQIINVASDGTITKTGDKDGALMSSIVDANGNARFIEDDLEPQTISGMTFTYNKWSLSGTHLMFVLAGTIADTTTIADNTQLTVFNLPDYIKDKIIPIIGLTVVYKSMELIASDYSRNTLNCRIVKTASDLDIRVAASFTASKDYYFRIQFDLLIDTE